MTPLLITQLLALLGLLFAIGAFARRWRWTAGRPFGVDRSPAKGSPRRGVLYAFTLGMAPWAKESTRRHMVAYLRGMAFHVGIFSGLAALLVSPWWTGLPQPLLWLMAAFTGFGALCGALGALARWLEHNLRALSTPDDYASVVLVTIFLAATSLALLNPAGLPAMYLASAVLLVYAPLGKIRHCIYFFLSRLFFGLFVGRRSIMHAEVTE